jgi:hypothetical protein
MSQPTLSYDAAHYEDRASFENLDTLQPGPIIKSSFIDAVAQSMGLQATDEDYRNGLHSIPMVKNSRT